MRYTEAVATLDADVLVQVREWQTFQERFDG